MAKINLNQHKEKQFNVADWALGYTKTMARKYLNKINFFNRGYRSYGSFTVHEENVFEDQNGVFHVTLTINNKKRSYEDQVFEATYTKDELVMYAINTVHDNLKRELNGKENAHWY